MGCATPLQKLFDIRFDAWRDAPGPDFAIGFRLPDTGLGNSALQHILLVSVSHGWDVGHAMGSSPSPQTFDCVLLEAVSEERLKPHSTGQSAYDKINLVQH